MGRAITRQSRHQHRGRTTVSRRLLQSKGWFTLSLVVLAESTHRANAVSFWKNLGGGGSESGAGPNSNNSPRFFPTNNRHPSTISATTSAGAGVPSTSTAPVLSNLMGVAAAAVVGSSSSSSGGESASCSATVPASPPQPGYPTEVPTIERLMTAMRNFRDHHDNNSDQKCCETCAQCMDVDVVAQRCHGIDTIPRGGHQIPMPPSATEAASDAAAATATIAKGLPLYAWKVLFQAILTSINVFCWLIPLRYKRISDNKLGLSLANAFSGGVFLSLAFGHLIPECVEGFHEHAPDLAITSPYLLILAGYLLIFFIEKVAFDPHDIMKEMEQGGGGGGSEVAASATTNGSSTVAQRPSDDKDTTAPLLATPNGGHQTAVPTSGRSAVILLGALAVHSVLEMMALGLSRNFGDCALLTLSIALHQPAESIALLVAFLKSGMPKEQIIQYLSVFSCMGPVGVALGMAVNEFATPIVDAIMLAIVAGTFVYVGATEVIPEEWEESEHKWIKFGALMSGIVSILLVTQYTMTLQA